MEAVQGVELQTRVGDGESISQKGPSDSNKLPFPTRNVYHWWFRVALYILFLVASQSAATLLGRLYFTKGGNSKWMATFVQTAGFPVVIPLLFFFSSSKTTPNASCATKPSLFSLVLLYLFLGLVMAGDNMMYSYGLSYLPVSTFSLLCGTQLAFNAIFSFLLNSQKFSALILNSLVLLTISACLLAAHSESDNTTKVSKGKYAIGFLCTLGASALFALYLSLVQLSFQKVIRRETFVAVLNMQIYPSFIATCACAVGLFASGEWKSLHLEMREYEKGRMAYVMTLLWTTLSWQMGYIGLLGLTFEVSSLFSNAISTVSLPVIPILAVLFFNDKMDGVKVIAFVLAIWGFLSYVYQHYLDSSKSKAMISTANEVSVSCTDLCLQG